MGFSCRRAGAIKDVRSVAVLSVTNGRWVIKFSGSNMLVKIELCMNVIKSGNLVGIDVANLELCVRVI